MKPILILSIFLQVFAVIKSQDLKNFTKASYGNFTIDQFLKTQSKVLPEGYSRSNIKSKGAIFISFMHLISERISIGGCVGSTKITSDVILNNQVVGILNRYLYTLAFESNLTYIKRHNFQLYAAAGIGYSLGKDEYSMDTGKKDSGTVGFMVFHLSPIAFKFGNRLAFFSELGFGYKGIANFGISYVL